MAGAKGTDSSLPAPSSQADGAPTGTESPSTDSANLTDSPFAAIVDLIGEGAACISDQGSIKYANRSLATLLGIEHREITGQNLRDLTSQASRDVLEALLAVESGSTVRDKIALRHSNGSLVPVLATVTGVDTHGATNRCLVTSPLAGQEPVGPENSRSAELFRGMTSSMGEGLCLQIPGGRIVESNAAAQRILGLTSDQLHGRSSLDPRWRAIHEDGSPYPGETHPAMIALATGESVRDVVMGIHKPDGSLTWMVVNSEPIRDPQTSILESVVTTFTEITAMREAQLAAAEAAEALADERRRLSAILGGLPDPHIVLEAVRDDDGVVVDFIYTDANDAACEFNGLARESLIGTRLRDLHPAVASSGLHAMYSQVLETGEPLVLDDFSYPLDLMGGQIRFYDIRAVKVGDSISQVWRDVTDRSDPGSEEVAQGAGVRFQLLAENAADLVYVTGPNGLLDWVSPSVSRVLGWTPAELLGTSIADLVISTEPSDLDRSAALGRFRLESPAKGDLLLELRTKSGGQRWMSGREQGLTNPDGTPMGTVGGLRDVTPWHDAVARISEAEESMRLLIEYLPVGVAEFTPDGRFLMGNPRMCEITGYSEAELQAMGVHEIVDPEDVAKVMSRVEGLAARADAPDASEAVARLVRVESRLLRKDGERLIAHMSLSVTQHRPGDPIRLIAGVLDVTEARTARDRIAALNAELEARVEQRTAELLRANGELESFTYSVSHDLRAPLRALSGFSEALVEEYGEELDETGRHYARRIEQAASRMSSLIDDILHLSRVTRAPINRRKINLSEMATEIVQELRRADPDRYVTINIHPNMTAFADRLLIGRVLQNLLNNAWKYTSKREEAVIEFGVTPVANRRRAYFVADNGAGFDPKYADKLFQPFQRLHSASDFPGNGIGLVSSARVLERHGGLIWAEGTPGEGATFWFILEALEAT